ncbi:hypothetical protein PULV_a2934 [Pseudoalteromonas ulvae UL12]|uniref:Uncharacterized protein n=1 Tax=Pseudoalteromonas ulvae TaxID=107327 RepID=A0A244CVK3_PSEDV|nr:lysozyme inhibitor LprI family protein [Pseudoalteromonas ulvae]MBE0362326.1 hypothetical protein [Pseudoalteromonas ulvae UL12]OUL59660.1 hypothetical protein B1199_05365 [Pseudoalteromonas ulvae]
MLYSIKRIASIVCATLAFLCSGSVSAFDDGCQDEKSTNPRYIRCLENKIAEQKRTTETYVNKISLNLEKKQTETGNVQLLRVFKRSEQEFDKYLEDSCRWRYLNLLPDTIAAAITYKRCELQLRQFHAETLKFK